MPIYKRQKAGVVYFSSKTEEPDKKKIASLDALRDTLGEETYQESLRKLESEGDNSDTREASMETLKEIQQRYDSLYTLALETRQARIDTTVELMQDKSVDLEALRKASGVSWKILRDWADEPAPFGEKKSGKIRVPKSVADELSKLREEASAKIKKQTAKK